MRNIVFATLCCFMAGCGAMKPSGRSPQTPSDAAVNDYDPDAMRVAIEKAKSTRAIFNKALASNAGEYFSVKYGFETVDGSKEHCWIGFVKVEGDDYIGELSSDPQYVKKPINRGDAVRIPQSEISDWMIMKDGKLYGVFTSRVIDKTGTNSTGRKITYGELEDLK